MSIDDTFRDLRTTKKLGAEANEIAEQRLQELQERVQKGESTGNPITDFVILHYHGNEKAEAKLQGVYNTLQKHEWELVMLRDSTIDFMRIGGSCYGRDIRNEKVTLSLGRICSPYLELPLKNSGDLLAEKIEFPVEKLPLHFRGEYLAHLPVGSGSAVLVKGDAHDHISIDSITTHDKPTLSFVVSRYLFGEEKSYIASDSFPQQLAGRVEVVVGNEAVKEYVIKNCYLMDQLVIKELFGEEEYEFRGREKLYTKISELVLNPEKRQHHLGEKSRREEEERVKEVNSLLHYLLDSQPRRKSDEVKYKLHQGIKLGAHEDDRTLSHQPGVQVNVKEYFRGVCSQYDVKVPERK